MKTIAFISCIVFCTSACADTDFASNGNHDVDASTQSSTTPSSSSSSSEPADAVFESTADEPATGEPVEALCHVEGDEIPCKPAPSEPPFKPVTTLTRLKNTLYIGGSFVALYCIVEGAVPHTFLCSVKSTLLGHDVRGCEAPSQTIKMVPVSPPPKPVQPQ